MRWHGILIMFSLIIKVMSSDILTLSNSLFDEIAVARNWKNTIPCKNYLKSCTEQTNIEKYNECLTKADFQCIIPSSTTIATTPTTTGKINGAIVTFSDSLFDELSKNRSWQISGKCKTLFKACTSHTTMEKYNGCLTNVDKLCASTTIVTTLPTTISKTISSVILAFQNSSFVEVAKDRNWQATMLCKNLFSTCQALATVEEYNYCLSAIDEHCGKSTSPMTTVTTMNINIVPKYSDALFNETAKNQNWQTTLQCKAYFKSCIAQTTFEKYEDCLTKVEQNCAKRETSTTAIVIQQTTVNRINEDVTAYSDPLLFIEVAKNRNWQISGRCKTYFTTCTNNYSSSEKYNDCLTNIDSKCSNQTSEVSSEDPKSLDSLFEEMAEARNWQTTLQCRSFFLSCITKFDDERYDSCLNAINQHCSKSSVIPDLRTYTAERMDDSYDYFANYSDLQVALLCQNAYRSCLNQSTTNPEFNDCIKKNYPLCDDETVSDVPTYSDSLFMEVAKNRSWVISTECRVFFQTCTQRDDLEEYNNCLKEADSICDEGLSTTPVILDQTGTKKRSRLPTVTPQNSLRLSDAWFQTNSSTTKEGLSRSYKIIAFLFFLFFIVVR